MAAAAVYHYNSSEIQSLDHLECRPTCGGSVSHIVWETGRQDFRVLFAPPQTATPLCTCIVYDIVCVCFCEPSMICTRTKIDRCEAENVPTPLLWVTCTHKIKEEWTGVKYIDTPSSPHKRQNHIKNRGESERGVRGSWNSDFMFYRHHRSSATALFFFIQNSWWWRWERERDQEELTVYIYIYIYIHEQRDRAAGLYAGNIFRYGRLTFTTTHPHTRPPTLLLFQTYLWVSPIYDMRTYNII